MELGRLPATSVPPRRCRCVVDSPCRLGCYGLSNDARGGYHRWTCPVFQSWRQGLEGPSQNHYVRLMCCRHRHFYCANYPFSSEPEAAAVHCAHLTDLHKLQPNQNFMICDAGGGTVVRYSSKPSQFLPLIVINHRAFADSILDPLFVWGA